MYIIKWHYDNLKCYKIKNCSFFFFQTVAPKISGLKDIVVRVGTTVKFDAKVIGEPPPKKVWFFGKDQQKTGGRVTLEVEDYKTKLVINSVERRDCGEYKLCVENNSGKDEVVVTLNVLGEFYAFCIFINLYILFSLRYIRKCLLFKKK